MLKPYSVDSVPDMNITVLISFILQEKSSSESDDVELKQLKPTLNITKSLASNSKSVDTMSSKSTQQKRKEGTTLATFRSGETTIFVGQTPSGIRR